MLHLPLKLCALMVLFFSAQVIASEPSRMPDPKILDEIAGPFRTGEEFSRHLQNLRDYFLKTEDSRAVFADAYVVTEKNIAQALEAHRFRNTEWMKRLTLDFSNLYREALLHDELAALNTKFIPYSWKVAFAQVRGSHEGVVRHLVLGMNAHIDRDLPFALESASRGTPLLRRIFSKFLDYNRVGRILVNEIGEIQDQLIEHFPEESYGLTHLRNRIAKTFLGLGILGVRQRAWELGMALRFSPGPRSHSFFSGVIEFRANFYANRLRNIPFLQTEAYIPEFLP